MRIDEALDLLTEAKMKVEFAKNVPKDFQQDMKLLNKFLAAIKESARNTGIPTTALDIRKPKAEEKGVVKWVSIQVLINPRNPIPVEKRNQVVANMLVAATAIAKQSVKGTVKKNKKFQNAISVGRVTISSTLPNVTVPGITVVVNRPFKEIK